MTLRFVVLAELPRLGGDPGVATYMNGVYPRTCSPQPPRHSGTWSASRCCADLRAPYGRNAVGGAINILYKQPTDVFEAAFKTIQGDIGTQTTTARSRDRWLKARCLDA